MVALQSNKTSNEKMNDTETNDEKYENLDLKEWCRFSQTIIILILLLYIFEIISIIKHKRVDNKFIGNSYYRLTNIMILHFNSNIIC